MKSPTEQIITSGSIRGGKTLAVARAIAECESDLVVVVACTFHCHDKLTKLVIEHLKGNIELNMATRTITRDDGRKIQFFVGEPGDKLRGLGDYTRFDD
jgi:hypothetical protein